MTQHEYDDARRDLVLYRIETAKEDLDAKENPNEEMLQI